MKSIVLPYQQRTRGRRTWRKVVALVCVVGIVALAAWWWRTPISIEAKFLYAQHRCMTHVEKPDQVVGYFGAADMMNKLVAQQTDFTVWRQGNMQNANRSCADWRRMRPFLSEIVWMDSGRHRLRNYLYDFHADDTLLFLHERKCPAGNRRLVCVELVSGSPANLHWTLVAHVIVPKTFPSLAIERIDGGIELSGNATGQQKAVTSLIFYAGQPDPSDESKFTIRNTMDGIDGRLDCRLEGSDTVDIVTVGPAASRTGGIKPSEDYDTF